MKICFALEASLTLHTEVASKSLYVFFKLYTHDIKVKEPAQTAAFWVANLWLESWHSHGKWPKLVRWFSSSHCIAVFQFTYIQWYSHDILKKCIPIISPFPIGYPHYSLFSTSKLVTKRNCGGQFGAASHGQDPENAANQTNHDPSSATALSAS